MKAKEKSINELMAISESVKPIFESDMSCGFCHKVFNISDYTCPGDVVNISDYDPIGCKDEMLFALDVLIKEKENKRRIK